MIVVVSLVIISFFITLYNRKLVKEMRKTREKELEAEIKELKTKNKELEGFISNGGIEIVKHEAFEGITLKVKEIGGQGILKINKVAE